MSKVVRERLSQTIELLQQGTRMVGRLMEESHLEDCLGLLEDCQNLAIALGTRIEKLHGEGTAVVSALEEYCERVYQAGEYLQAQGAASQEQSAEYGALCDSFIKVQDSFDAEFPDKLEVVFLPYKASMWDALESVWMAARDDENCEAYVIPIPYYTLDGQRNFKDFCYEGDQYPDYVPVTDYKAYDLELHHPDIIFIHNPYDDCNTVTSIAPEFYSKTIKDYTEKLVYIPYFVLDEIDPCDQATVEGMKHFCFLPGTLYADQVIVQSEDMREIYIAEYAKVARRHGIAETELTKERLEEKFLGLGSPKFDKVLNTRKEDLDIPEDWKRIIEKPDGSWKKIIFYNTSINALLINDKKMLVKMKGVFQSIKENKEEIALLWRPHPLIKDTIESMRPHLWMEYQKLVQQYQEEGWGIYDDSADMDRAVVLSDAYYGDLSSVLNLYQRTDKPAMVQSLHVMDSGTQGMIYNDGLYRENDTFWFVGNEDNILYKMKNPSMEVAAVVALPQKGSNFYRRYPRCIKKGNYVYCLPDRASCIQMYNLKNHTFCQLIVDNPLYQRLSMVNNWLIDNRIWSVSNGLNSIIAVNTEKNVIENTYRIFSRHEDSCGHEAANVGEWIYCISKTSAIVVKFHTVTGEKIEYHLPTIEKGFNTIAYANGKFYLTGYKRSIYCWDEETQQLHQYDITAEQLFYYDKGETDTEPRFYRSVVLEDYVVFVPWITEISKSNRLLCLNLNTKQFSHLVFRDKEVVRNLGEQFTIEYQKGNILGVHDYKYSFISEFDIDSGKVIKRIMRSNCSQAKTFLKDYLSENGIIVENVNHNLEMLLKEKFKGNSSSNSRCSIFGERIWQYFS